MQHRRRLGSAIAALLLAVPAAFAHPGSGIAVNRDGRVFFIDTGAGLFSIVRQGQVMRHDGPAYHWFALDSAGKFRNTPFPAIPGGELQAVGTNPTVILSSDLPVAVADGSFYFPERTGGNQVNIIRVTPTGQRSVRATLPHIRRTGEVGASINGLTGGPNRSLYYTEDRAVRIIDARGRVRLLANVEHVPGCVAIPGVEGNVGSYFRGIAVAPDGTAYVAASGCGAVLKISPRGVVSPILRSSPPWSPTAIAFANGEVYVLEYLHTASDNRREWLPRVRKISRDGGVVMLANTASR